MAKYLLNPLSGNFDTVVSTATEVSATTTNLLGTNVQTQLSEIQNKLRINYILNPSAEVDTTGWATYADAAASRPVDGTGGSPTVTWTRSTSSPLRGSANFLFTKDAANRQGQGASYAFSIDRADQAKVLQISFDYEIASGTYSGGTSSTDSDLIAYIYDVTNATLIEPAPFKLDGGVSGVQYKFNASFQTASNSTSYRLIIHTATTSASAFTVKFDNVSVSPQVVSVGGSVGDWQSFPMTITGATSNPTKASSPTFDKAYWRRVGDSMEIWYHYAHAAATGSAAGSGTYYFSLPSAYTIDSAKVDTSTSGIANVGTASIYYPSNIRIGYVTPNIGANKLMMVVGDDLTTPSAVGSGNWPITGTGVEYAFKAVVPIAGWGTSQTLSSETDTRVVAFRATGSPATGTLNSSFNTTIYGTVQKDSHGAYNATTGIYTVQIAGYYDVLSAVLLGGTLALNSNIFQRIMANGVSVGYTQIPAGGAITQAFTVSCQAKGIYLEAGQTINVQTASQASSPTYTSGADASYFEVTRVSGPSQIAASETISFAANTSTTAASTSQCFIYTVVDDNTHGAYSASTGKFTAPIQGRYCFQWTNYTPPTTAQAILYVNGTAKVNGSSSNASTSAGAGSATVRLLAGDVVEIRPETTATAGSLARLNCFSGFRVGS